MLTWSKINAIVPDEPLRWILATLRFYAIVASVGIALAFVGISILAGGPDRIRPMMIAMIILFTAATYFTGRLSGKAGLTTGGIACVIIFIALWALGLFLPFYYR